MDRLEKKETGRIYDKEIGQTQVIEESRLMDELVQADRVINELYRKLQPILIDIPCPDRAEDSSSKAILTARALKIRLETLCSNIDI